MLIRLLSVSALANYRLYVEFSDGEKGELDLSCLTGKGVFKQWNDYEFFRRVRLGAYRCLEWEDEISLCADALYLQLTGKTPEELFPKLGRD